MQVWRGRSLPCGCTDLKRRDAVPEEKRTQFSLGVRTLFQEGRSSDLIRRDAVPGGESTQIRLRRRDAVLGDQRTQI